jgi:hypothetical protein
MMLQLLGKEKMMMIKKKDGQDVYPQDRPETQAFITENIF